ncbi:hypothetical protein V6N11_060539 [Hibiscus sabdariffa]|uniref:Uncharacterized protein n=1 Tax=Hibiscus sabdariffa TaxID=183260 RepID=A0ABR2QQM4_9ROSI
MVPSLPLNVLSDKSIEIPTVSNPSQVSLEAPPSTTMTTHVNNADSIDVPTEGFNSVDNDIDDLNFVDSVVHSLHTEAVDQPLSTSSFVSPVHSQTNAATDGLLNATHEDVVLPNEALETVNSSDMAPIIVVQSNIHPMLRYVHTKCFGGPFVY